MSTETRTSFTPGPWRNSGMVVGREKQNRRWEIQGADEGRLVAEVRSYVDAALIAAAPELYEALREMVKYHDDLDCWHVNEFGHTCDSNPANEAASPGSPISVARTVLAKLMAGSVER